MNTSTSYQRDTHRERVKNQERRQRDESPTVLPPLHNGMCQCKSCLRLFPTRNAMNHHTLCINPREIDNYFRSTMSFK